MEPSTVISMLRGLGAVLSAALKPLRRRSAEAAAATAPAKFQTAGQALLDGVLRRITTADPNDSQFTHLMNGVTNRFFTPEFLRTPNVQAWLADSQVRNGVCQLANERLLGARASASIRDQVEARFRDIAMANAQESAAIVDSMVAMLAAGVRAAASDPGAAALVEGATQVLSGGIERLSAKLDGFATTLEGAEPCSDADPLDDATTGMWRAAFDSASAALLRWPTTVGGGKHIPRAELGELLARVQSNESGVLALLGVPGSGKSALLAKLALALSGEEGMAVLAIKGDLLDPEVEDEKGLQQDLRLPELPSTMLRRLAASGPVALLIDQLDALAGHLDAKTGRLSALLNLAKAASGIKGVYVFVSCREFEFAHDVRLSHIEASSIALDLPSWETVLAVLEEQGIKAAGFNTDAKEVLRVPQHLNTFLQLRAAGIDEPVSNYTAMLDRLWSMLVLNVPGTDRLARLAFDLADTMAEKEVLWLAAARFDDRAEEVSKLKAAGILTTSVQGAIGFSHQTVFEHVLARSFAKNEGSLSAYVLARADSLFVRPKLWAALAYMRGVERETYEAELAAIWNSSDLRKHLRFLLIEFMGSQPEPTDKEELLLVAAGTQPELSALVLKAINGSPGWFNRLAKNFIARAMIDEMTADLCVSLLTNAWSFGADTVSELVREQWVPNGGHERRALFVLEDAPQWTPGLIDAAKDLTGRCQLHPTQANYVISAVGASEPNVAVQLLRRILDGELARCTSEARRLHEAAQRKLQTKDDDPDVAWWTRHRPSQPIDNLLGDSQNWSSLPALAVASPGGFLTELWPWYLRVFQALLEVSTSGQPRLGFALPYGVDFRFEGEDRNNLEPSFLLEAISLAVEELAKNAPDELGEWATEQGKVELAPVQRLIAHALAAAPARFASQALQFLLDDERRYLLGGLSDSTSTTEALIAACATHWSPDEVLQLAKKVQGFSPTRPADMQGVGEIKQWHRRVKAIRLDLLCALPERVRPADVQRELDEAIRANPGRAMPDVPSAVLGGARMKASQFVRASIEDIVNVFKEIPDESAWDHPSRFGRGGNIQLSREFASFAKEEPQRALEVVQQLQPGFGQRAVGYAIEALCHKLMPTEVMNLIEASHRRGFDSDEFREAVARAVDQLVNREVRISDPLLSMLEGWLPAEVAVTEVATKDVQSSPDGEEGNGFLLSGDAGLRMVSGGDYPFLSTLIRARFARGEAHEVVRILRAYLTKSSDPRVWEFLTDWMPPLAWEDSENGIGLINEVLSKVPLEGTRGAAVLMAKISHKAMNEVLSHLPRWRNSTKVAAQKGYGELVALVALSNPAAQQAKEWLDELVDSPGGANGRAGATASAVQFLWIEPEWRGAATDLLLRLLARDEEAVWRGVFRLFNFVDKLEPEPHTVRLMEGIADRIQSAPSPSESYMVERLSGLLPRHAEVVANIATHLIQLWRDQLACAGSSLVTAGQEIMDLALTLHRTEGTKLEGLQMFEQLIEIDAYQAREVLDELDHRIRLGARPPRPRLRRRGRLRTSRAKATASA